MEYVYNKNYSQFFDKLVNVEILLALQSIFDWNFGNIFK